MSIQYDKWITYRPTKYNRNVFDVFHGQQLIGAVRQHYIIERTENIPDGYCFDRKYHPFGTSDSYPTFEEALIGLKKDWEENNIKKAFTVFTDSALRKLSHLFSMLKLRSSESTQINALTNTYQKHFAKFLSWAYLRAINILKRTFEIINSGFNFRA